MELEWNSSIAVNAKKKGGFMINGDSVLVMNERTYLKYLKEVYDLASEKDDPIEYLNVVAKIKVIIDNEVKDDKIEVWGNEEAYHFHKNFLNFIDDK